MEEKNTLQDNEDLSNKPAKSIKPKRATRSTDRVILNKEVLEKIDLWISSLTEKKKGLKLKRKDIVNWIVQDLPNSLPAKLEKGIIDTFYDEELFLKHAIKEVKKAKAEGRSLSVREILNDGKVAKSSKKLAAEKKAKFGKSLFSTSDSQT